MIFYKTDLATSEKSMTNKTRRGRRTVHDEEDEQGNTPITGYEGKIRAAGKLEYGIYVS